MSAAGFENGCQMLALALVMITTLAAMAGLRRDRPWLPAMVAALAYAALSYVGLAPERVGPMVGSALIAGLALARFDGGRSPLPLVIACGLASTQFRFDDLGPTGPIPSPGMPLFPILVAALTAFAATESNRKQIWLFAGLVGMINVTALAPFLRFQDRYLLSSALPQHGLDLAPFGVLAIFVLSRWLYPAAKAAGPAMTAFFVGLLTLFTVAGIWADVRVGAPVAGWLSLCLAALLPVMLDEWRTPPDRSFGLDRYFGEAMALAAALGVGWMAGI